MPETATGTDPVTEPTYAVETIDSAVVNVEYLPGEIPPEGTTLTTTSEYYG